MCSPDSLNLAYGSTLWHTMRSICTLNESVVYYLLGQCSAIKLLHWSSDLLGIPNMSYPGVGYYSRIRHVERCGALVLASDYQYQSKEPRFDSCARSYNTSHWHMIHTLSRKINKGLD